MCIEYKALNKHIEIKGNPRRLERLYTTDNYELWYLSGHKTSKTYHPTQYYIVEILSDTTAKILHESGVLGNWYTTRKKLVQQIIELSRKDV